MNKQKLNVCGPHLPGTASSETTIEGGCDETHGEDEADSTYPYDRHRFVPFPACAGRSKSSPCILFYRRQFPVYPEAAPTEAWDMLRLHLGHVVHQAAFDLNLPIYAVAAAVSAFHAVFPGHFTKDELCSSPHIVSRCMAACLFLAGKTSETNLKLREAVNCIDFLQWKLQQQHRLHTESARGPEGPQERQHDSFEDSETMGVTSGSDEHKSTSALSVPSSSRQWKAAEQQGTKAEHRDDGKSGSSAPAAAEEEGKYDTDTTGQMSEEGKKVNSRTKPSVKGRQSEEGSAQEGGSNAGTARSQCQRGESSKGRLCGIAGFSRSSRYLKGYVPMGIREYWHVRQECLREEERLLQALGFSLPLPYLYDVLLEALVLLLPTHQEAHLIWAMANDLTASPLLEQFSPPVLIAAAALCAKKLLAVAAASPSSNHEAVPATTTASPRVVPPRCFAGRTRLSFDATLAAEAKLRRVLTNSELREERSWRNSYRRSASSRAATLSEVPPANPRHLICKAEPQEESGREDAPMNSTAAPRKIGRGTARQATKAATVTRLVGAAKGERAAAAASAASAKAPWAASKAEDGMLEVLERLDPLLCGSPEYWAMCKGHERRGLERGGSRWARALPPAALGWAVFNPPNSAPAAGDSTGPPATVDVAPVTKPVCPSAACGARVPLSVQVPANSKAVEPGGASGDGHAAVPPESEEQAECKRLLSEKLEDQRQRKLVYVQVAEACARLMEVYSLLLKSQRPPGNRGTPAA